MTNIFLKIIRTPSTLIDKNAFLDHPTPPIIYQEISAPLKKMFRGSLAIRVVTAGSSNACEQELVALGNSFYDMERFGIHFVASPRHADMLMVTGPVSRNMRDALLHTYEAIPDPRVVIAVGDDAISGGIFRDSYGVYNGVHNVIPVNYQIPGDPPSPRQIISSLLWILNDLKGDSSY
jgi:Ni,Fe-hydrogenase III small subunit